MKRFSAMFVCLIVFIALPAVLLAEDLIAQGKTFYEKGKMSFENYKTSGDMFAKALESSPSNYEAAWKAARSYREYANEAKKHNIPDWKAICKEYGKLGMKYGEKAIALNGNGVEGNFWYGCSVGNYSDAVSILTALKEGLKDKTQSGFEKSYQANKMYFDGGPMKALGRFWFVLPWPLQDKKLSLQYLREFQKAYPNDPEGQIYLAETLIKTGDKDEAKALLHKSSLTGDKYYADWAKKLLTEL